MVSLVPAEMRLEVYPRKMVQLVSVRQPGSKSPSLVAPSGMGFPLHCNWLGEGWKGEAK